MNSDTEIQSYIYKAQVDKAFESLPSSLLVNLVNSCVLVYVQWELISRSTLIGWFSILLLITLIRVGICFYKKKNVLINSRLWRFIYIVGLLSSGLIWGSAGIFLFPENDIAHQIIVAFVLGGMVAGAAASSAALSGGFYFYCIPAMSPIFFKYFLLDDQVSNAMAFMIIVFTLFSIATYRHIHKMILNLITSQIKEEQESKARRLAEIKMQQNHNFLEAVLYNIEDGIVACDERGELNLFNRATSEFHGIPQKTISPEGWANHHDLFAEDGKTPVAKENIPLYKAFQGEHVRNQEMYIIPEDGEERVVVASGQPLFGENGEKIGAVVSMHDITQEKKAKITLQKAYDDLELKIRERTEELFVVNRDLRQEIEERKKTEKEKEFLILKLQEALIKVKTLSGFLPICASCKKIRDDQGYWNQIETYIRDHSEVEFSHSLCPDCAKKLYPEFYEQ